MSPDPLPKYIYKIIPSPPPEPIPAKFPLSELDRKDGFIHFSTATQVPLTADMFFDIMSTLWVIKLPLERFSDSTKWEDGFPHLYGNFGAADVHSVEKFVRTEGQKWSESMKDSRFLQ